MGKIITDKPLMQEICDKDGFVEEWEVVINKTKYPLNPYQSALLISEVAKGNRGVVMFKKFGIPIPFMEEFYLVKRYIPDQEKLTATIVQEKITEEERQRNLEKITEIRKKLFSKGLLTHV